MKKYSVIYADPPWRYRVYSKKGLGRSAESHYPTMSLEEIKDVYKRQANKYGIDYALKKDTSEQPPRYRVFFKGRDVDVMTQAFKEFSAKTVKQKEKQSLKQKLSRSREQSKAQHKEKVKVKIGRAHV